MDPAELAARSEVADSLLHQARPRTRPRDARQEAEAVIVTRADVMYRLGP